MKVSALRHISKFIDTLLNSGYDGNTDITILLADMEFTTLPDNLIDILTEIKISKQDITQPPLDLDGTIRMQKMHKMLATTDIEKLITICDELCITQLTEFIISLNKPLHRIMDNHIINYDCRRHTNKQYTTLLAYNTGYKVLCGTKYQYGAHTDILENCIKNGMYIKNIRYNDHNADVAIPIADIEEIDINAQHIYDVCGKNLSNPNFKTIKSMVYHFYDKTDRNTLQSSSITIRNIISAFPSMESFTIEGTGRHYLMCVSDTNTLHPVTPQITKLTAIKSSTFTYYRLNNIIHELFGNIRELHISSCILDNVTNAIPNTVKRLSIDNTYINDATISTCTKIRYLSISNTNIISNTNGITTCAPFAKTLNHLILNKAFTIKDEGLALCTNLKILDVNNNYTITTCDPFAKSLVKLYAGSSSRIGNDGLALCSKLKVLHAQNNPNITTCAPFAKSLTELDASYGCNIDNDGIKLCSKLTILHIINNPKITTCEPFANSLEMLYASGVYCGIGDDGLESCSKLRYLDASCNPKITTCTPFANTLLHLIVRWDIRNQSCGITNKGIKLCTKLIKLDSCGNRNITLTLPIIYDE